MHAHARLKSAENQKRPSLIELELTSGVHIETDPPVFVWQDIFMSGVVCGYNNKLNEYSTI